ncbi:MAG: amino acid ABC transporter ATP-binding protein, partial [Clostridiales bacterium]|nr:amino acid ABC transporter ATP-binding protein [Clostridiales bacterium]
MNLNIKNLSKHYDEEKALDNLDLTIHNMKAVAVVGPSGGGKSTLLRLIAGLEAPTGGLVSVNGIPIDYTEKMLREYRKRIGFVFQSHNLFPHWSAVKNITVPLVKVFGIEQSEAKERALALLTRFGLEEHAKKL